MVITSLSTWSDGLSDRSCGKQTDEAGIPLTGEHRVICKTTDYERRGLRFRHLGPTVEKSPPLPQGTVRARITVPNSGPGHHRFPVALNPARIIANEAFEFPLAMHCIVLVSKFQYNKRCRLRNIKHVSTRLQASRIVHSRRR